MSSTRQLDSQGYTLSERQIIEEVEDEMQEALEREALEDAMENKLSALMASKKLVRVNQKLIEVCEKFSSDSKILEEYFFPEKSGIQNQVNQTNSSNIQTSQQQPYQNSSQFSGSNNLPKPGSNNNSTISQQMIILPSPPTTGTTHNNATTYNTASGSMSSCPPITYSSNNPGTGNNIIPIALNKQENNFLSITTSNLLRDGGQQRVNNANVSNIKRPNIQNIISRRNSNSDTIVNNHKVNSARQQISVNVINPLVNDDPTSNNNIMVSAISSSNTK
jgi:hypothetical protein